ncbi:energy transducer TonB [Hymenobacter wooponensis]|uniref:TonB C-terminal domain-containing protein n=1 Tax=Hymenobacter wooponensis TaxID=1525360 RepID=A0A4Z0MEM9_9BACT|nr:energy transducer TonB [Hymenobacter wooponensis]TGD77991.1 hypothetical protein EU557_22145 [Hymenobacter wooponensis]
MSTMRCVAILSCLLLSTGAAAQNSYNWWDAHKPAPVTTPPRPKSTTSAAPKLTESKQEVILPDSAALTTGGYVYAEQVPVFPGGQAALAKAIQKTLKWPSGPKQHVRVFVHFTVLPSGDITDVWVAPGRGISDAYDAAAVACVSRLPKFSPGQKNGKPVAVATTVPVDLP